jgi:hypothetical protein
MTITSPAEQAGTTPQLGERAVQAIATAKDLTWGWGKIAQFLADNSDLAEGVSDASVPLQNRMLIYIHEDSAPRLADIARRGVRAGAKVEKDYDDRWGAVCVHFGPVHLYAYAPRAEVCERVVVGTREVVEEVKDPEALAAVPMITQTRVEEIVEWQCRPILAAEQDGPVPA